MYLDSEQVNLTLPLPLLLLNFNIVGVRIPPYSILSITHDSTRVVSQHLSLYGTSLIFIISSLN